MDRDSAMPERSDFGGPRKAWTHRKFFTFQCLQSCKENVRCYIDQLDFLANRARAVLRAGGPSVGHRPTPLGFGFAILIGMKDSTV